MTFMSLPQRCNPYLWTISPLCFSWACVLFVELIVTGQTILRICPHWWCCHVSISVEFELFCNGMSLLLVGIQSDALLVHRGFYASLPLGVASPASRVGGLTGGPLWERQGADAGRKLCPSLEKKQKFLVINRAVGPLYSKQNQFCPFL